MRVTQTPAYRKAFDQYIRHGTPIGLSLKADGGSSDARPTTHYIWRTQGDGRVRPSHRANDGKIFGPNHSWRTIRPRRGIQARTMAVAAGRRPMFRQGRSLSTKRPSVGSRRRLPLGLV
mgnify:CR=1 FL=1